MWYGQTEANYREVFRMAREAGPALDTDQYHQSSGRAVAWTISGSMDNFHDIRYLCARGHVEQTTTPG